MPGIASEFFGVISQSFTMDRQAFGCVDDLAGGHQMLEVFDRKILDRGALLLKFRANSAKCARHGRLWCCRDVEHSHDEIVDWRRHRSGCPKYSLSGA